MFTVPQRPEAMQAIVAECAAAQVPLHVVVDTCGDLLAWPQSENASLAVALFRQWMGAQRGVDVAAGDPRIREALLATCWPGRQQHIRHGATDWFLDGAHTAESMAAAAAWFGRAAGGRPGRRVLVFHCSADRDYRRLLGPLQDCQWSEVCFVPAASASTAARHHEMARQFGGTVCTLPELRVDGAAVLVTGSLHLVGDVLRHLGCAVDQL